MNKISQEELEKILRRHQLWLNNLGNKDAERADLSYIDLSNVNLSCALLHKANLFEVNLRGADLRYANLSGADLTNADLRGADLRYANLDSANLNGAHLDGAILCQTSFRGTIVEKVELIERNKAKMVRYEADGYSKGDPVCDMAYCPNCNHFFELCYDEQTKFCPNCGQRLKWEEDDEENEL